MVGGRRTRCTQETRVDAAMSLRVGPFEGDPAEWDGFVRGSAGWTHFGTLAHIARFVISKHS